MNRSIPLLFFLLVTGCATTPFGQQDLLAFLQEGTTRKDEVLLKLGEPAGKFQNEEILTYRLGKDQGGYFLAGAPAAGVSQGAFGLNPWFQSLVLVFNDQGILRKYSLVELLKESP